MSPGEQIIPIPNHWTKQNGLKAEVQSRLGMKTKKIKLFSKYKALT